MVNNYDTAIEPDRCMAQIVTVDKLSEIPKAEKIELAYILGWQCVVKEGEFKVNDLAIYFSIDSVLDPNHDNFKFLKGERLRTRKIMGALSQGLLAPISWLNSYDKTFDINNIKLNDDVTKILNVRKFVINFELQQYDELSKVRIPSYIPKTDEERVQNISKFLSKLLDQDIIITRKEDGTSTTFIYYKGDFLVCGRNFVLSKQNDNNHYFEMVEKFDIENKMGKLGLNIAIQGETVGPKINGNKLKLQQNDFRVFNIWNIDEGHYMKWEDIERLTNDLNLNRVPLIYRGKFTKELNSVNSLLEMAEKQEYVKNIPAEGIVVKTNYYKEMPRHSFKVISNKYLLKYNL